MSEAIVCDHIQLVETAGYSSKGNQLKWKNDQKWYKADYMGYEGLAEVLVSRLLKKTMVKNFVEYSFADLVYHEQNYHGCSSDDFLSDEEELITVGKLYRRYSGHELAKELAQITEVEERICFMTGEIESITGLEHFGRYLSVLLTIDAFFMNEDRHTNNIAVIHNSRTGAYRYCPYFDFGLSLFSDITTDYPVNKSIEECRNKIEAKPFDRDFDIQLDAAENLYGQHVKFDFTIKDALSEIREFESRYDRAILTRVEEVLRYQILKYEYLFYKKEKQ
ncbi:MAG: hypothetical protein Q4G60_05360 [bacterium]|nr:hypothetical protein [bacterium]